MADNRCVVCGEIIPEGRQICVKCESLPPVMIFAKMNEWKNRQRDMPSRLEQAERISREMAEENRRLNDELILARTEVKKRGRKIEELKHTVKKLQKERGG